MKIKYKIIMLFIFIALLSITTGYLAILKNESTFKDYLGEETINLADSTIHEIDREISEKIEESEFHAESLVVIEEIEKSNNLFEVLDNREDYIDKIDAGWKKGLNETNVLIKEILENKGSILLGDIKEFYKKNKIDVYPEIFITNKYGVLVSSTGKTSDYRQNDEEWWKIAKENGVYLEEPNYDESSGETGLIIASSIYNKKGEFIGVIKEILSIKRLEKIIQDATIQSNNTEIKLISRDGKVIFQSIDTPYSLSDFSKYSAFRELNEGRGYIIVKEEWDEEDKDKETIISYSKSDGYDNFKGFGWIILIENDPEKALGPAIALKKTLIYLSIIINLILLCIGIFFSYKITKPIEKIKNEAENIAKGNLDIKIDMSSNDEIGVLARTIEEMVSNMKKYQQKNLELEKEKSKSLETEVSKKTKELSDKIAYLNDTKTAMLNIMEDVSKANEELKDLDKAKSEFLNIVSHELKTPLTAMIAYLEVLDDLKSNLTPDELKSLEAIRRNANNLKMLISNILEIARMESGKFELTKTEVNLNNLIQEILSEISILAKQKGLELKIDIQKNLPKIELDDSRIKEVFNNLLTNAIKFTEKGSIKINAKKQENNLVVSVQDTGVGIPKDKEQNLFQKFYQVDASISRRYGGTGLGLSITKKIIEAHGGQIKVESIENKGTTFSFTIPLKQSKFSLEKNSKKLNT